MLQPPSGPLLKPLHLYQVHLLQLSLIRDYSLSPIWQVILKL